MKDCFSLSSIHIPLCYDLVADTIDVGNLVGKVHNLCRVSNYLSSRVCGHGRLERTSPSRYFVVNLDPSLTPRCLADWD